MFRILYGFGNNNSFYSQLYKKNNLQFLMRDYYLGNVKEVNKPVVSQTPWHETNKKQKGCW